jgi:hypothetical protein
MKRIYVLLGALLALVAVNVSAVEERGYSEGPVSVVTAVKVVDGQYDNYLAFLGKTYKPLLEAQKAAGIIVGYNIYDASPRMPSEADLYLVVTYPNMASFDGLADKTEPLMAKITGLSRADAAVASADRGKMRQILGNEMIREVILK